MKILDLICKAEEEEDWVYHLTMCVSDTEEVKDKPYGTTTGDSPFAKRILM
jgi:hypothetical protein